MNPVFKFFVLVFISFSLCLSTNYTTAFAQAPAASSSVGGGGPRKQLAIIIFSGLAGAVLGLSTLSFYGRPQERLSNIAVGFALGVITGSIYTTYRAASAPDEFYNRNSEYNEWQDPMLYTNLNENLDFSALDSIGHTSVATNTNTVSDALASANEIKTPTLLNWQWEF